MARGRPRRWRRRGRARSPRPAKPEVVRPPWYVTSSQWTKNSSPSSPEGSAMSQVDEATAVADSQEVKQYLTFLLGGETFALSIQDVKEILQYTEPTAGP